MDTERSILFRAGSRAIFAFGFAKNDVDNIDDQDVASLKKAAKLALAFSDAEIALLLEAGTLAEVHCDE